MSVRAGIYCRISLDALGDTTKTDDQERICRDLCHRLGWTAAAVYTDSSRSAWRRDRRREAWDAMLADVKNGQLDAIVVYHGDRLIRQPWDLELLLNLAAARGVRLASPTGTRDLSNPDDQFILRIEAAMACRESDNISRRKKAGFARMRRDGLVRSGGKGGRAFGFATDGVTHVPAETAIIREAAARILAGEAAGSVGRDLTARGVRTTAGSPLTHATITATLRRPRYAGLMPDGLRPAAWEPVLERGEWEMVRAVLSARAAGFGGATNARRYLLSGIAVCGACGSLLQIRQSKSGTAKGYGCVADGCRKTYRSQVLLDAYVTGRVVGRLSAPANPAPPVNMDAGRAAELAALQARRAETEAFIAGLADAPGQRIDVLARALDSFDTRIAAITAQMAGDGQDRIRVAHAGVTREGFEALSLDVRRGLVLACYRVVVLPASRRGPGFNVRDVALSPV